MKWLARWKGQHLKFRETIYSDINKYVGKIYVKNGYGFVNRMIQYAGPHSSGYLVLLEMRFSQRVFRCWSGFHLSIFQDIPWRCVFPRGVNHSLFCCIVYSFWEMWSAQREILCSSCFHLSIFQDIPWRCILP